MILRLAVYPSFQDGFAVEVVAQVPVDALMSGDAPQSPKTTSIIRTQELACPSLIMAAQLRGLFSALRASQILTPDDAAPIPELVRGLRVGIPSQSWVTCDGTPTSFSIESGDLLLALEWNPEPPAEWQGVRELAAYLESLYSRYRHLRDH